MLCDYPAGGISHELQHWEAKLRALTEGQLLVLHEEQESGAGDSSA